METDTNIVKHFSANLVSSTGELEGTVKRGFMLLHQKNAILEDLRSHAPEQLAELRELLAAGAPARPDPRRLGFYEVDGRSHVYYVFVYAAAGKVMLLGVWEKDPVAQFVACTCPAA